MFKVNNRNTRTTPEADQFQPAFTCSKCAANQLTDFYMISLHLDIILVSLLLIVNRYRTLFWCFHCWLWIIWTCFLHYILWNCLSAVQVLAVKYILCKIRENTGFYLDSLFSLMYGVNTEIYRMLHDIETLN